MNDNPPSPLYSADRQNRVSGSLWCELDSSPFTKVVWDDIAEVAPGGRTAGMSGGARTTRRLLLC